jgi:hypothetical protein
MNRYIFNFMSIFLFSFILQRFIHVSFFPPHFSPFPRKYYLYLYLFLRIFFCSLCFVSFVLALHFFFGLFCSFLLFFPLSFICICTLPSFLLVTAVLMNRDSTPVHKAASLQILSYSLLSSHTLVRRYAILDTKNILN